mgnify:CR=1 FL=1
MAQACMQGTTQDKIMISPSPGHLETMPTNENRVGEGSRSCVNYILKLVDVLDIWQDVVTRLLV